MGRRKRGRPVHGWVPLDKPVGMTSTQAVGRIRRLFDAEKAGHAGTLDPLASGLLPIALGEATKTVPFAVDRDKAYEFTVRWGEGRSTDDTEGEITETSDVRPPEEAVRAALANFIGRIEQVPPRFSAIKVAGERAYDLARAGEVVELSARLVDVYEAELLECPDTDTAAFRVACGKGTYVRAIARDLAHDLGTCAHVTALRRTSVGPFDETNAISLEEIEAFCDNDALEKCLLPVETVLDDIPALAVTGAEAARLRQGQPIFVRPMALQSPADFGSEAIRLGAEAVEDEEAIDDLVCAMERGKPVALGHVSRGAFHPTRVFRL